MHIPPLGEGVLSSSFMAEFSSLQVVGLTVSVVHLFTVYGLEATPRSFPRESFHRAAPKVEADFLQSE